MSEFDDSDEGSDILADIQALDEALALTAKRKSQEHISSNQQSDVSLDIEDSENNDDYFEYLSTNRCIDNSLNAYEINTRLITGLTIAKKQLIALLEECEQKIKLLDEKIMKSRDESNFGTKLTITNAGMPYFKDKNYFSAPRNYDAKLKEARGELFLPSMKNPSRWTGKDRETLLAAIKDQAIELVLSREYKEIDESNNKINKAKKTKLVLPRNFNEMVEAVGEKGFDWHKISVLDFDSKHSPGECQAMWNVYLQPNIKKSEWTSAEDNKLLKCAKEYKYQDWDVITQKLGTNRSAYQCFIRYNTIKKVPSAGRPWTKQEDKDLNKIVNALRIGDYIPWAELANHMRHRTKQQIYVRWVYRKAPHLTKGRFTCTETSTLLKAVKKYGTNFCKIASDVMPHRTSMQLQQRYNTVMATNLNLWTVNDDLTLINLHMKYCNNWSKIATYFSKKSRTQVRHRYTALLNYVRKGVSLEAIPRPAHSFRNKKLLMNKKLSSASKIHNKTTLQEQPVVNICDIQLRLYETLCFPPSIKSNNSEEPYNNEQLVRDTKKLYNTLNLLNANLDIPSDFLNYVQLGKREKQLLVSLKEYMNLRNNRIQNNELIELFRTQMFGYASEVSEDDFFIPPLPFDGHVKAKKSYKIQKNTSIDYDLDVSEKFAFNLPTVFPITHCTLNFIDTEEEIQFSKFSQFLTSDYHNCDQQNVDLYKSLKCIFVFNRESTSNEGKSVLQGTSENDELNMNSTTNSENCEKVNKLKETNGINEDNEETNTSNIILPSQATLLGFKNLLLWKLLYDYQNESRQQCESMKSLGNERNPEQSTNSQPVKTESAEYQLLRTRLSQLFKFPISLSNTILQIQGPDKIFVTKEKPTENVALPVSKKRKFEDTKCVKLNKKKKNVPANSDSQPDSNVTTQELPVRSCKMTRKNYKIMSK